MSLLEFDRWSRKHKHTEEDNCKEIEKTVRISDIRKMRVLEIISKVLETTRERAFSLKGNVGKYLKVLSEKLDLSPIQCLFLSLFVDQCDDRNIRFRDLANHFENCTIVEIIQYKKDMDAMAKLGIIVPRNDHYDNPCYSIPFRTLEALCEDTLPSRVQKEDNSLAGWLRSLNDLFDMIRDDKDAYDFEELIHNNFEQYKHLECVKKIRDLHLDGDSLKMFLIISTQCIVENDSTNRRDCRELFDRFDFRWIERSMEKGDHPLFEKGLVEHDCEDGIANPHVWCLTNSSKNEIFGEFEITPPKIDTKLKSPETIVLKELFYDEEVSAQVDRIQKLLLPEKMNQILEKLSSHGYRKGFACLFYGGPGTGKTETVLQLAKATGRSIMQVDISQIRDKYVGETEKRIKATFDTYRKRVKEITPTPILFFNEADALFMNRMENAEDCADKMENAMQNIILQEMENLEGILMATTNLTSSLDDAFERRFLFKIEFTKPSPEARRHIWQAMLPELSDADALMLARRFDFSGGQIENIARKRVIDDILNERDTLDIDAILENCRHESLNPQENSSRIGFVA